MRALFRLVPIIFVMFAAVLPAMADTGRLELSVTYRERIALPPDAQLEVQLLDVSRTDAAATRIASQRVALTGVPMRVILPFDTAVIDDAARYEVVAEIWSGSTRLFRTTERYSVLDGSREGVVEMVLTMVDDNGATAPEPLAITGVEWVVTEVAGTPWANDDPATLNIDEEMNVTIFGGCNRFVGVVMLAGSDIAFPENLAGTLMACPQEVETLERGFLDALREVAGYLRHQSGLVLTGADGRELMHFVQRAE